MVKESNVYLLDNDNSARKGLSRLIHKAGFNVLSFSNAESLLNELKPNDSGTLVTNLGMPEFFAEELVKELKYRQTNIKIIVVSDHNDPESQRIANEIGAIGFFRKPVDGTALIDAINWSLKT
jgi:FixJ family two-component response regulator